MDRKQEGGRREMRKEGKEIRQENCHHMHKCLPLDKMLGPTQRQHCETCAKAKCTHHICEKFQRQQDGYRAVSNVPNEAGAKPVEK